MLRAIRTAVPPARLTWVVLLALGAYASWHFGGLGVASLIALPVVAAVVDVAFQSVRFPGLRFPDAAVATGAFLALIFPPTVPLFYAGTAAFAAIGLKHALRLRGRPILNPAAAGVVLGVFVFGLAPAWWAGVDVPGEVALVALGLLLVVRSPGSWRLPATFFLVYAPFSILVKVLLSAALAPKVLLLGVLDPATLFFGLYMVLEPRTAPRNPILHPLYAACLALGAALFPIVLPSAGILVSLLVVGLGFGIARFVQLRGWIPGADRSSARSQGPRSSRKSHWAVGHRIAAGVVVLVLVGAVAASSAPSNSTPTVNVGLPPHSTGGGGSSGGSGGGGSSGGSGGGITTAGCTNDNSSIPSSTLSALHKALGPSVILTYNAGTGETVFYDPVNQVTVTETDLYEDYGFAEFNGDDFAVSGCSG